MATAPPLPKSFENARMRHMEVERELERICSNVHFRTSKRACEFLRYVVRVTLDGRVDSLKERSIGIDLLGRDISYDPSSDAIVRVRANDVRKRLSSYYASADLVPEIQINLPTGSYVPCFLPGLRVREEIPISSIATARTEIKEIAAPVPPLSRLALMRPALIALLLCALLMRHRMEDREPYLRFWDHILGGRNALLLSVASEDRVKLASSLYPIVWIAGRYGVDTAMEDNATPEIGRDRFASVQESLIAPIAIAEDRRLRWVLNVRPGVNEVTDHIINNQLSDKKVSSAALLTILPEDTATLHIQGTDNEAIRHLLEELTSQKHFPDGMIDQLDSHHLLQVLLSRDGSGQWQTQLFAEGQQ